MRGDPETDTYYSFLVGRLDAPEGEPYYDSDWANVLGAVAQIREWGKRSADGEDMQPLCIYLPITYPHPPYGVEDPWFSGIDRSALPPRIPADPTGKPSILNGIRERQALHTWTEERWMSCAPPITGCARGSIINSGS